MAKRADARPHLAHRLNVQGIERADRIDVEVERAAVAADRSIKFLIATEYRAGNDASLKLKQHNRARHGAQPR